MLHFVLCQLSDNVSEHVKNPSIVSSIIYRLESRVVPNLKYFDVRRSAKKMVEMYRLVEKSRLKEVKRVIIRVTYSSPSESEKVLKGS